MSEHTWFQENLAGYCAGGLSVEEGERFQRHRIACAACAGMLAEAKELDQTMDSLFAPVRPTAGWENRVIETLRAARWSPRSNWPRWARVAASVAALVVLGGLGSLLHGFVVAGDLAFPGTAAHHEPEATASRYASQAQNNLSWMLGKLIYDTDNDGEKLAALADRGDSTNDMNGELSKESLLGSDVASRVQSPNKQAQRRMLGRDLGEVAKDTDEAESLRKTLSMKIKRMRGEAVQSLDDLARHSTLESERLSEPAASAFNGRRNSQTDLGLKTTEGMTPPPPVSEGRKADVTWADKSIEFSPPALGLIVHSEQPANRARVAGESKGSYFTPPMSTAGGDAGRYHTSIYGGIIGGKAARSGAQSDPEKGQPAKVDDKLAKHEPALLEQLGDKDKADKSGAAQEPKAAQPKLPSETASRKIIRTGEIDFEVDGFDAAVAGVTRLVNGVKGAFVTTVNSDKLPNGKVKGSMVVRLPPENVDKFLLDVRRELAKIGELKSQRIGSQDVSKQYTDVESRLRGARAMEERFLQIIKTGKGEIKDLVIAENALGVWRTKIEEMEGEIRYYNNQVGLSTLTITLIEKEIQAPAALIVTERVKMQLEVDDVEKAQQAALAAVAEAKGRVTKSELKQHAAGQLEAILHFEVAPADADMVRDRLKELGIVTHQDGDRTQQTEGAGSRTPDIKIKKHDVKFEVGMYNSANIQPREVLVIQIASLDVPAGFRKLQEAAAKAKGQVRTGQLNEQDKLNVSAQFDFDVPSVEKKAVDQALADVGKVISRAATQAAPGEAATDRKIGYRLNLRNVAALPSREKVSLGIEVKDVDQTVTDILDMVKTRQGHIAGAQMNHERNGHISAILVFDVPLAAKDELIRQLKTAGTLRLQTSTRNPQVPENELATAHIDVTLTSSGPIVPSDEGLWPQIRTSLFYSFKLLSWSLMFVILGLSVILPWVLVLWGAYKLVGKWRKKPATGSV
ncbi:MAG TPA: DUF4349 domain-containing protein [Gemmataceae bacterium]|jgi:anti-sigma factor RsiW|nr:DUF4349 domain-containing protein [Gemmataceae bacterium]